MSDMATTFRVFVALNPPAAVLERLALVQRRLKRPLARSGITWAKPGQIHLTLKFLGDVPSDTVAELQAALEEACSRFSPLVLRVAGLGVFPGRHKPRVIWAGLDGDIEAVKLLAERVEGVTQRWRERETREFRPHLTLGRVRHISLAQTEVLLAKLQTLGAEPFGGWRVERVELMRSTLTADGAVYASLAEWALA